MPYHLRVTPKMSFSGDELKLDLGDEQLKTRYLAPFTKGESFTLNGKVFNSDNIDRIKVNITEQESKDLLPAIRERRSHEIVQTGIPDEWFVTELGVDVTDDFITHAPGENEGQKMDEMKPNRDTRAVFVVHGRNEVARAGMFDFLRALDLHPIEWSQAISMTQEASPYIGTVLDTAFSAAQAVIVLVTPDEITYLRTEYASGDDDPETKPSPQARPNVLFEAGMAMGRDPKRTILVELGYVRPFSDVAGRHVLRFDGGAKKRKELAQRLETAGCPVDTSGHDWLTAGELTPPPEPGNGLPLGKKVPQKSQRSRVQIDLRHHSRGSGSSRLEIINRGTEPIFNLNIELPPEAGTFSVLTNELPIKRLPPGKSAFLMATSHLGPRKDHFDVHVTGNLEDDSPVSEEIFLSISG